ncbi:MAG: LamG-like jellyroll fold domain-containing protein [Pseudomonadota bacterium]
MANGETQIGTVENDTLTGADGADVLNGGYGDDRLIGGAGNDQLDGGRGSDLLIGGDGDDALVAASDAGEPEIGQEVNAGNDPDGEVNAATNTIYPDQPFVADDILIGGAGADTFIMTPLLNAKEDILRRNADQDGNIDWTGNGVAGENDEVHDHWPDSIGTDIIADYDKAEGDRIIAYGHTTEVDITYDDVDGDGDQESIIQLRSNQANGGAHDDDLLGRVIVHGDRVEASDVELDAGVFYGVIENISQIDEAIAPTGVRDENPNDNVSENPFQDEVDFDALNANPGPQFAEYTRPVEIIDAADDVLTGTEGADQLVGDSLTDSNASLDSPLSFWRFDTAENGVFEDARDISDAGYYSLVSNVAVLQSDVPTTDGPNGGSAALFDGENTFAYASNDSSYQVLNGTVTASFRADDLGGMQTILAKDERNSDEGGHFHISVAGNGQLRVRLSEGEGEGTNHAWQTNQSVVQEGQWHHVAVTFGAAGATVYLDGQALPDSAFREVEGNGEPNLSAYTGAYVIGNDKPFVIGANTRIAEDTGTVAELGLNDDLQHYFEGAIADVGFWGGNTPSDNLTAEQIATLAADGPGALDGAVAMAPPVPVGDDQLIGNGGDDALDGGAGNDSLDGGDGSDNLMGGYGDDVLEGGAGSDVLDGGHGEDVLTGGAGDDTIISRADGREPVIAQDYDASDDPNAEIDPVTNMLYPSQANMPADDVLTGGTGADEFLFQTLINGKEEIINQHVNNDRTIDWMGVAGENDNVHDHWVDGIGNDTITDFNRDEGDKITIEGHTTEVYQVDTGVDADGDGAADDSVLHLRSNQGNGGGAHNLDLLGTINVLDATITDADYTTDAAVAYGIVETIDEIDEAITPLMRSDDVVPVAEAPDTPETPDVPEVPDVPDTPDTPDAPTDENPDTPDVPDTPDSPDTPEVPDAPDAPTGDTTLLDTLLTPSADNPASDVSSVGDDLLIGTADEDDLAGSWGDDRIVGGAGEDDIRGGHGDDLLAGGDGDDLLAGDFGDDILIGGVGQDEIHGNRGEDVLVGGEADDFLDGGAGDDVLSGGAGDDMIDGGRGQDVMVLAGSIDDYTITVSDGGLFFANAAGETDLVSDVEHVYFSGQGEVYSIQDDGTLVVAEDRDEIEDLLEGDLLGEILGTSGVGATPAGTVDQALAEMAEMEAGTVDAPATDDAPADITAVMDEPMIADVAIADAAMDDGMRVG